MRIDITEIDGTFLQYKNVTKYNYPDDDTEKFLRIEGTLPGTSYIIFVNKEIVKRMSVYN